MRSAHFGTTKPGSGAAFFYRPYGAVDRILPFGTGPAAGGNTITIVGFFLGNVTNVTVAGVPAQIVALSASSGTFDRTNVTIVVPPHAAGTVPLVMWSDGFGETVTPYVYNPPGQLHTFSPHAGRI